MKRSSQVAAPLLAAAALALSTGCRRPEMQRCVDEQNHVVADNLCSASGQQGVQQQPARNPAGGFFPLIIPYRYYYGGGGGYGLGSAVTGGSFAAQPGHSYSRSGDAARGGTSRGGFGGTRGGSSGGEGGGE